MAAHSKQNLQTKTLAEQYDYLAPDKSEIRLLATALGGSMCHCTLSAGGVSKSVVHKSVEEIWYCLSGEGQVWRKEGTAELITDVEAGCSLNIPQGTSFQFRNTGDEPLCFIIATIPPWPGENEAIPKSGKW